jgi:hypothetical protein
MTWAARRRVWAGYLHVENPVVAAGPRGKCKLGFMLNPRWGVFNLDHRQRFATAKKELLGFPQHQFPAISIWPSTAGPHRKWVSRCQGTKYTMDAKFGNQVGTDPQKPSSAAARFLAVFGTERETKPEANNRNMSTTHWPFQWRILSG